MKITITSVFVGIGMGCSSLPALSAELIGVGVSVGHTAFESTIPGANVSQATTTPLATMTYALENDWYVTGALGYSDGRMKIKSNSTTPDSATKVAAIVFTKALSPNSSLSITSTYARSEVNPAASSNSAVYSPGIGLAYAEKRDFFAVGPTRFGASITLYNARSAPRGSRSTGMASISASQEWNLGMWVPSLGIGYTLANRDSVKGNGDNDYFKGTVGLTLKLTEKDRVGMSYSSVFGRNRTSENSAQLSYSRFF